MRKYRALLINPWIYDVAAYDLWAKPLGLLYLASLLQAAGVEVFLLDCLDRFDPDLLKRYPKAASKAKKNGTGKFFRETLALPPGFEDMNRRYSRYGLPLNIVVEKMKMLPEPDVILVTSMMTYWYPAVTDMIALCRERFPGAPILLGGIYATLCPDHAGEKTGADLIHTGEGEPYLFKAIQKFCPDFPELAVSDDLDSRPFPALDLYRHLPAAPLLTSRGCPFRCTFCAAQKLQPGFRRRSKENVVEELERLLRVHHVKNIVFYDDALLVDAHRHLLPILEEVIRRRWRLRFHTPNGLHPRYIDPDVAKWMLRAGFETIRLSFETAATEHQERLDHKVSVSHLERAVQYLEDAGFPRKKLEVYLLTGLPGQPLWNSYQDMLLIHGMGVKIRLAQFTPIPGTLEWDTCARLGMREDIDLLYTNNSIFAKQWGEAYFDLQQKLHHLERVLNYAVDLDLRLSGFKSIENSIKLISETQKRRREA